MDFWEQSELFKYDTSGGVSWSLENDYANFPRIVAAPNGDVFVTGSSMQDQAFGGLKSGAFIAAIKPGGGLRWARRMDEADVLTLASGDPILVTKEAVSLRISRLDGTTGETLSSRSYYAAKLVDVNSAAVDAAASQLVVTGLLDRHGTDFGDGPLKTSAHRAVPFASLSDL